MNNVKPFSRNHQHDDQQSGFMLVALLVTIFFIMLAAIPTAQLAISNLQQASVELYRLNTQFAADAGLDDAIQRLNQDPTFTGTTATLLEDSTTKTTYETTLTDDPVDPFKKYISVTARTLAPKTNPTPRVQRKFEVELRGVSGGNFSVVTGVGGLNMTNNSKIVGGNVYVNGAIDMSNSAQIGLTSNPVNVKAAHQSCPSPPDATYPRTCASGENGQPISLVNSAKIYGEVKGTNQTNGAGMSNPGLVSGSVSALALPPEDRPGQVAAVVSNMTGSAASCSNNAIQTWPANLKITGDVTISNGCDVTVEGNVWITGSLRLTNSSQLIVKNGLSAPPVIMIDASSGLDIGNNSLLKSNNSATPVGFRIITYWSEAACSPDCLDVTGVDLYASQGETTIDLSNGASGPNTEFYARWSQVEISNSGNIGALVGQTVKMSNSGTITFGTNVSGVGGIVAWVVESYKRSF